MAGRGVLLFYDADCRLCAFFRNLITRLDVHGRIRSIPLSSTDADPFRERLGHQRWFGSMHAVGPDGKLVGEGRGLLRVLGALPMLGGLARLLESSPKGIVGTEVVYTALVLLRDALSR